MSKIITNSIQADRVFERLVMAYQSRKWPYTQANIDRRHRIPHHMANFYFYLCHFMCGAVPGDDAVVHTLLLYQRSPELFDPYYVITLSPEVIESRFEKILGTLPVSKHYGTAWFHNSEILVAWGGRILNVFRGVHSADQLRARIANKKNRTLPPKEQGFFGFQDKLCAKLAYLLMDAKLIPAIRISPPIDFCHLQIVLGTEMILADSSIRQPSLFSVAGLKLAEQFLRRRHRLNPVEFADMLSILSQEGCAQSVKGGDVPDWDDPKTHRRFERSCGRCPVEWDCRHSITAESYPAQNGGTRKTHFIVVTPRPKPPIK